MYMYMPVNVEYIHCMVVNIKRIFPLVPSFFIRVVVYCIT